MHYVVFILIILAILIGPGLWVSAVMRRYHLPRNRYTRTGGETARAALPRCRSCTR